jgi:hypothetical protein
MWAPPPGDLAIWTSGAPPEEGSEMVVSAPAIVSGGLPPVIVMTPPCIIAALKPGIVTVESLPNDSVKGESDPLLIALRPSFAHSRCPPPT